MENQTYCTQQNGGCQDCSLVNYNRDCKNNPVASNIVDGYCRDCESPVIYCIHAVNHHNSMAARINADIANDPNRIKPDQIAAFFSTEKIECQECKKELIPHSEENILADNLAHYSEMSNDPYCQDCYYSQDD